MSFNKFLKTKIIKSVLFSEYIGIKMEISKRDDRKFSKHLGKKPNKLPSDLWVKEEVAKKFKSKYIEVNENTIYQNL